MSLHDCLHLPRLILRVMHLESFAIDLTRPRSLKILSLLAQRTRNNHCSNNFVSLICSILINCSFKCGCLLMLIFYLLHFENYMLLHFIWNILTNRWSLLLSLWGGSLCNGSANSDGNRHDLWKSEIVNTSLLYSVIFGIWLNRSWQLISIFHIIRSNITPFFIKVSDKRTA